VEPKPILFQLRHNRKHSRILNTAFAWYNPHSIDLQQLFKIETNALDCSLNIEIQWPNYHNNTLSNIVHRYPTYDKEMYSIVKTCR
jgi:hypothetical protein